MAQAPRPQSPWQPPQQPQSSQNQNQNHDSLMPPAKRQKLSPSPASSYSQASTPYASSSATYNNNISLPQNAFNQNRGTAYYAQNQNDLRVSQQQMPPPPRPGAPDRTISEKPAQKEQREREANVDDLTDAMFGTGVDLKAEEDFLGRSYHTYARAAGTGPSGQTHNYDLLSRNNYGNLGAQRGTIEQKSEEEIQQEKRQNAARRTNEAAQWHLSDPFLYGASVRLRMQAIARENVLSIPIDGLFDRINSDKTANAQGKAAPSMLHAGSNLETILTLLSLATRDRLRGVLEDAYGLSRARASNPLEEMSGYNVTSTPASQEAPSIPTDPKKDTSDGPTPAMHPLNTAFTSLTRSDRRLESSRNSKRSTRRQAKAARLASAATGTTAPQPTTAPLPPAEKKAGKKDANAPPTAGESAAANTAAAMAIGSKKYSWMSKGAAPAKPSPAPKLSGGNAPSSTVPVAKDRTFGSFKEAGGVQLRDLVKVLEGDGRQGRTLQWAYNRLEGMAAEELAKAQAAASRSATPAAVPQVQPVPNRSGTPGPPSAPGTPAQSAPNRVGTPGPVATYPTNMNNTQAQMSVNRGAMPALAGPAAPAAPQRTGTPTQPMPPQAVPQRTGTPSQTNGPAPAAPQRVGTPGTPA